METFDLRLWFHASSTGPAKAPSSRASTSTSRAFCVSPEVQKALDEHVESFLHLGGDAARTVRIECETDKAMTFIHVTRDLESFSKDELVLLVNVFTEAFRDTLVRNPAAEEHFEEDPVAQEELIDLAIDSMRDPKQSKSLVGFREEKRVLVYFLKSQKKAKASGRS